MEIKKGVSGEKSLEIAGKDHGYSKHSGLEE
jgi:hypothetical protein